MFHSVDITLNSNFADLRCLSALIKEHGITVEEYYGQYLADGSGDYKLHRNEDVLDFFLKKINKKFCLYVKQ